MFLTVENVSLLTLSLTEKPVDTFAEQTQIRQVSGNTLFAYGNMIRYDPTLVDLISFIFVLCINMNVYLYISIQLYLYNYSYWVELSMNIHEGKG